ncbi:hypothetical protein Patl1_33867 [Pistacia atlantica]|uniref:Uncharacterized protein n=1 Tax=Pistacia atlantica TaxID=434234 RepID=A0ACC0ZUU3_9ROSI|nr:hypothetical protein Patl1_33867 [Pistacia atlantica]
MHTKLCWQFSPKLNKLTTELLKQLEYTYLLTPLSLLKNTLSKAYTPYQLPKVDGIFGMVSIILFISRYLLLTKEETQVFVVRFSSFWAAMKNSPIHLDYETSDYGVHEFDPQIDFSQFLEEAKQHAREMKFKASSTCFEETRKGKIGEEKKIKKSWKNSLFRWLKVEKKSKPCTEPANTSHISKPRKGHVSGPIYGSGRGDDMRRPTSGPITSFFKPIKRVENEIPYMCLDQLNDSHHVKSYGPVYLVT